MNTVNEAQPAAYRIGAVAKVTGISPDKLRVWERRYAAVIPERSANGGRLYSPEDIARLRLMRQLVEAGDSIGAVATLSVDALKARAAQIRQPAVTIAAQKAAPVRTAVVGHQLVLKMEAARDSLSALKLNASYRDLRSFENDPTRLNADLLLIEQATLQPETAVNVLEWMRKVNASWAILVYRFAAEETLRKLPKSVCSSLRAPVDMATIENHCAAVMLAKHSSATPATERAHEPLGALNPPRRYDDETLARIATMSPTVECECPRHLAELLTSLSAFEQYSAECESRNPDDAALHSYLSTTTAHARQMVEEALDQVIAAENIKL